MQPKTTRTPSASIVAILLWLASAILGLWLIVVIRDMVLRLYVRFGGGALSQPLNIGVIMVLAVVWIALVIGGGEYHYRHVGERRSWKLFAWTFAAMAAILLLALVI